MPGGSYVGLGNMVLGSGQSLYASLLPPATVTTNSSTTSTYTINGLAVNDMIDLYPQATLATSTTYLTVGSVWVSAANTLSVQWVNSTSASSSGTPSAIVFILLVNRSSLGPYPLNSSNWPSALE